MLDSHAKQCLALIGGQVVASLYGTSWSALGVGRAVGTLQGAHGLASPPFIKQELRLRRGGNDDSLDRSSCFSAGSGVGGHCSTEALAIAPNLVISK